jgi:hypothetical protein
VVFPRIYKHLDWNREEKGIDEIDVNLYYIKKD